MNEKYSIQLIDNNNIIENYECSFIGFISENEYKDLLASKQCRKRICDKERINLFNVDTQIKKGERLVFIITTIIKKNSDIATYPCKTLLVTSPVNYVSVIKKYNDPKELDIHLVNGTLYLKEKK